MIRSTTFACLLLALAACDKPPSGPPPEQALMESARAYMDKHDYAAAVIQLKNLLARKPDSAEGRQMMGRILLLAGEFKAAVIELGKARDLGAAQDVVVPDLARAMLGAGEHAAVLQQFGRAALAAPEAMADLQTSLVLANAKAGNLDAAREAGQKALTARAGYAPARVALARVDLAAGDRAAALRRLDEVLAATPAHEQAGLLKADILLAGGKEGAAAVEVLRKVREAHPKSHGAAAALTNALVQIGQVDLARKEFDALKQLDTGQRLPETQYLKAQFAFAERDFKGAAETLDGLLGKDPNHLRALVLGAAARFQLQQYPLAEGLLARALKLSAELALARQMLAQIHLRGAQPAKALDLLQPLLSSRQPDRDTLALAGEAYLQIGDFARSEAAYRQALKVTPVDAELQTAAAMAQLARGDRGPALAQLESIARTDPGVKADLALINELIRRNDTKGVLKALEGLERKLPDSAVPHGLRGRVLAGAADAQAAGRSFEKALAKDPRYLPAAIGLAEMDVNAGRFDQARARIDGVIQADPHNVHPRLARAELEARLGAAEASVHAFLTQAVKADPVHPAGYVALVNRLLLSGNTNAALTAAQGAAAALPSHPGVMEVLGRAQLAAGDGHSAITTFKKLTAALPADALPLVQLAEAQLAGGDAEAAGISLRQALRAAPGHPMALRSLALLAAKQKRVPEALALARDVQHKNPKDSFGHALEGEIHGGSGDWSAAAQAFREALRRAPSNADLAVHLHGSLVSAGKAAEANRLADEWLKAHPKDTLFLYHLGDRAVAAKDWMRAESNFRAVLAVQPRHAAAMNNLAWALASQKKQGATALAEQAVALLPDRAALLDTLAFALEADQQIEPAISAQRRAVVLEPKSPELRLRLAQLLVKAGRTLDARKELDVLAQLGSGFAGQAEVAALMRAVQ